MLHGLEVLTGEVVSSCQVVSSLRVWLLVSASTPEGQAGIHDLGQYPPDTARAGYFQCELPLCPSLAEKCPHLYANALPPHLWICLPYLSIILDPSPQAGSAVGRSIRWGMGTRQQQDEQRQQDVGAS